MHTRYKYQTSGCSYALEAQSVGNVSGPESFFFFSHFYFPASGQAVVTGVVPFFPPVLAFDFYRAYTGFSNPTARRFLIECC